MARMLALKQQHGFPKAGLLPSDRIDVSLYREESCPSIEEFDPFEQQHPEWGMPFGLPALTDKEHQTVMHWLEAGAPVDKPQPLTNPQRDRVRQWEVFLNGDSLKNQLMSRYIYEHWFLAHLYFDDLGEREFFELVRSKTPPGQTIALIATRRPFDDPQVTRVYYRLRPVQGALLAKTHDPYPLNPARMARLKNWFIDAPYSVTQLPSYEPDTAANPFVTFEQLPVRSRYRLMLEEAQFTIMGFIKGPVCRGQVAINVINDYFWVGFLHPDHPVLENQKFLATTLKQLELPIGQERFSGLLKWRAYSQQETEYLQAKSKLMNTVLVGKNQANLAMLWDGDGDNPNAGLTVFRNFDNASVVQGLVGEQPQTAMIMGYPLLERIHYLLVAGFDVFGTIGHQVQARLYMDFLRMEGEFIVLALMPAEARKTLSDRWYRNAPDEVLAHLQDNRRLFYQNSGITYKSDQPWTEFLSLWKQYLKPVLNTRYELTSTTLQTQLTPLKQLAELRGKAVSYLPETAFITVVDEQKQAHHFTLLRNSAHSNVSELFKENSRRLLEEDTLTLAPGFLGVYPNAFYQLETHQLPEFIRTIQRLNSEAAYADLSARFAIRRTHPDFWHHADTLHEAYRKTYPIEAGLFDFNRVENR
jgi:hypothetical protein